MQTDKRVVIAGEDVGADLIASFQPELEAMIASRDVVFLPDFQSALQLKRCRNQREFLRVFLEMTRIRQHIDTNVLPLAPGRTPLKRMAVLVRKLLWRVLKYQHERMAFRLNLALSNLANMQIFMVDMLEEHERLVARIDALEQQRSVRAEQAAPLPGDKR
jgi:hypothetical protein